MEKMTPDEDCSRRRLATGKIPPDLLEQVVFKRTGVHKDEVLRPAAVGEDTAVIDLGGELLVATTDPITGATDKAGWLAIKVALNDLGAAGADPVAVLLTLLLPEGADVGLLQEIMDDVHEACVDENVAVAGGHSEVTPGIDRPLIIVTALGKARGGKILAAGGAKEGDDILVTKWAGMEGTGILVKDFGVAFDSVLSPSEKKEAAELLQRVSVTKDGKIALDNGATGCHDATEGGVLGAIYEVCRSSGLGAEVDADQIPVHPITRKVADFVGIDPLRLISSGCLVVTAQNGHLLEKAFREGGLAAQVVGKMVQGEMLVKRDGTVTSLEPPSTDEIWPGRERLQALQRNASQDMV